MVRGAFSADLESCHSGPMRMSSLRWAVPVISLTTVVMLSGTAPGPAHALGQTTPRTAGPVSYPGVLQSVSAVSGSDVWAVGFHDDEDGGNSTLIEHWDGRHWHLVESPSLEGSSLYGVSAVSASDAWAVGYYFTGTEYDTLVEHWDGTSWTQIPSPSPGGGSGSYLDAVSARSATDAWAVGYTAAGPLIEHWNGTAWSLVGSPGDAGVQLNGVSAVASDDAFAVGNTFGALSRTFILRWNGTKWRRMDSTQPAKAGHANRLDGVSASSSTDVWAVGTTIRYQHFTARPLIEHYDGTSWSRVTGLDPGGHPGTRLAGVSAVSPTDVWAVGFFGLDKSGSYQTFIEHWNGTSWKRTHTVRPSGSRDDSAAGIDAISPSRAWAAGSFTNSEESMTMSMTQNWDGQRWLQL